MTRPHQLEGIVLGDDPGAWAAAGFTVRAVGTAGDVTLGRTTLRLTGTGGGVLGWSLHDVPGDLDGIADRPAPEVPDPGGGTPHPNGVRRIDHVVVATDDRHRTVGAFGAAGLELRRTRDLGGGASQSFLWAGDVILEVVSPPPEGDGRLDGTWIWGLSLESGDLDATAAALGPLLGRPRDAVQPGRRIAILRTRDLGIYLPLAVMSPHRPTSSA